MNIALAVVVMLLAASQIGLVLSYRRLLRARGRLNNAYAERCEAQDELLLAQMRLIGAQTARLTTQDDLIRALETHILSEQTGHLGG